ncbi:FecR family protein [Pseudogemmobacter sonorensis]|uniref:FecR family protein n=1 Tax=Pseudogemmobacter sonorensis TaxID=2989681 RepID=UPI0036B6CAC0
MPTPHETDLFEEAVTHAVRLQANPQSSAARTALAIWRARSPAHESAWSEIAEIHGMAGSLLVPEPCETGVSRRKVLGLGLLGIGLAGGAGIFGPGMILAARADHMTATAEIRDHALPDGSVVSLGPASAIALDFSPGRRDVRLLSGMIWCRIVPAPDVFHLRCGGTRIDSTSAELSLSQEDGLISLALDRGQAWIATGSDSGTELVPGDWLELEANGRIVRRIELAAAEASAWRNGIVTIEAEPLSVVVARIARWLPGRVMIADPGLGEKLVSGVFDMSRPRDALLAAVSPYGARLHQITPWMVVVTSL